MGDVLTFTPRQKPISLEFRSEPLTDHALRVSLEEAAQVALDAADHIIAVLNSMDGDGDPSLAAPENTTGSQVAYMRGGDQDREVDAPETALPEVAAEPQTEAIVLPWCGRGNVIAAVGVALLDMVGGR